jgi:ABC-2 type transport system permease protein
VAEPANDAVIVDRGYRHYEGSRSGSRGAMGAIVREGYRRVLGLRRKARRKVLPWFLITLALASVAILIGIHWVASNTPIEEQAQEVLPRYGEYFDFISVVALLFMSLAAAELFVPDRVQGVLNVYFSRPLDVDHYLLAKVAALASLILSFYLVPQLAFHIGLASVDAAGFIDYLTNNLDVLWKIPATALVYFAVHASVAVVIAAFLPRVGAAAGLFLGTMFILNGMAAFFIEGTNLAFGRYFGLIALEQHPRYVRDWIFDIDTIEHLPERAGFEPWASLVVTGVLVVLAVVVTRWQYRRIA